jgi:hypothetical protein
MARRSTNSDQVGKARGRPVGAPPQFVRIREIRVQPRNTRTIHRKERREHKDGLDRSRDPPLRSLRSLRLNVPIRVHPWLKLLVPICVHLRSSAVNRPHPCVRCLPWLSIRLFSFLHSPGRRPALRQRLNSFSFIAFSAFLAVNPPYPSPSAFIRG